MDQTDYPEERALDGVYFRMKRNGTWRNICFSDLTLAERDQVTNNRTAEWLKGLCYHLANAIREIGDQFDITAIIPKESYDEEEENV